jgi:hypothetical protein
VKVKHSDRFFDDTDYIIVNEDERMLVRKNGSTKDISDAYSCELVDKYVEEGVWVVVNEEPCFCVRLWKFLKASFRPIQGPG